MPEIVNDIAGVELNRKSPRATWARKEKNLWAQLHVHEPNIVCEISIFISMAHLNVIYHFYFAKKGYTVSPSSWFCISVQISIQVLC